MEYEAILKLLKDHRRDIGSKASPVVRLRLRTGERFTLARLLDSSPTQFVAFAFLEEEPTDETPRYRFIAVDPKEICLIEAFEPEPRAPDATKRFSFAARKESPKTDTFTAPAPPP